MIKISINQLNLVIDQPQWIMILGNNEGKTKDILDILNGKNNLLEGQYYFKGRDVGTFTQREMAHFRKKEVINFSEDHFLMENFTVEKNLQLQLKTSGIYPTKGKRMIGSIFEVLDLKDIRHLPIAQLSPLQKLQVRLAKAIVVEPTLIYGEDIFLDIKEAEIELFRGWIQKLIQRGISTVMVTVNPLHLKLADQEIIHKD